MSSRPLVVLSLVVVSMLSVSNDVFGLFQNDPPESVVVDARKELAEVEGLAEKLQTGDKTTAQRYLKRLDLVLRKLKSARNQQHPDWADAAQRYNALTKKITDIANAAPKTDGSDPAAIAALDTEVRKTLSDLKAARPEQLDDKSFTDGVASRIADYKKRHAAMPAENRQVAAVGAEIERLAKTLESFMAQRKSAGRADVLRAELQALMDAYLDKNLPAKLSEPLSPENVRSWAKAILDLRDRGIPEALARVEAIAQDPDADKQRISSARHWIGRVGADALKERLILAEQLVDGQVTLGTGYAEFLLEIDPADQTDVQNKLLSKGRFDEYSAHLQDGLRAVESAMSYDAAVGRKGGPDRVAQKAMLEKAVVHLKKTAESALSLVRMPPARSTDKALLASAEETLKLPKYGVKGWERMVISMDKRRQEKYESTATPGTSNIRITTYHYVWDEFIVTTVEKSGSEYYLWVNRLKFYHSADTVTPTGQWILSQRFQSTRILEGNF